MQMRLNISHMFASRDKFREALSNIDISGQTDKCIIIYFFLSKVKKSILT